MLIILSVLSIILILAVLSTLVRNDFWLYKIFEYPRLQKLTLLLLTAATWFFYTPQMGLFHYILLALVIAATAYTLYKVWPYTVIAPKEMKSVAAGDAANELKIFSANVYQYNREYQRMLDQIKATDPDLVFLLETDAGWAKGVQSLQQQYPYALLEPLDNTYGLLFYSRLPLHDAKVAYLVKKGIPSIEGAVQLPSGQKVKFWGLHPEPPVPGENLYATAKDKELMKVALKAKDCTLPTIVFGDLNDVAWSHTTELFRKTSALLDPRRGRGFYSTFSAHHWYIRFPLDYIFCSPEFGLVQMKRMPKNGSDHFATFTHLVFHQSLQNVQAAPEADKEEVEEAKEMASQPLKA